MRTYEYPSRSDLSAKYVVTVTDDRKVKCTCRGFKTPARCWHFREVCEKEGILIAGPTSNTPALEHQSNVLPFVAIGEEARLRSVTTTITHGFVEPMCARALKEHEDIEDFMTSEYVLEVKYDGHRLIVQVTPEIITCWARGGNPRTLPPHLVTAFQLVPPGTYDGELHIPGHTSTDVTRKDLQHLLRYAAFDMLAVGDASCRHMSHSQRRMLLETAFSLVNDRENLFVAPWYPVSREALDALWTRGEEGCIIKKVALRYEPGVRSPGWVKFKKGDHVEVTVTGFLPGSFGPHSRIVAVDDHGIEVRCKSLNDRWRAVFATRAAEFLGQRMVLTYQVKTRDGRYRHPMADHFVNATI